jgi:hypothetical protein
MKRLRVALAFALAAGFCLQTLAQSVRIEHGVVTRKKFGFYWETRLEPPTPAMDVGAISGVTTSISTDPDAILRVEGDRSRRVYFAYQARVEVLAEPNTYRITFSPVDSRVARELMSSTFGKDDPDSWKLLSTPGWGTGSPQTIHGGDVVAMDLLMNAATGQKIVDYVTVQEPPRSAPITFGNVNDPPREFAFATGRPRDFRPDDGELRIRAARVSINGKLDPSTATSAAEFSGVVVWFYLPNRGRFLLSLTPHPDLGFRKAGEVRGSTLSFSIGSEMFKLVAGGAIAPTQAAFNLYVRHDPAWKPDYPFADLSAFIMGAADRADLLVRK